MKSKSDFKVIAINTRVLIHTNKNGYIIEVSHDAGTALDRIKKCHDYSKILDQSFTRLDNYRIFKNKFNHYLTFAMYPKDYSSNYIITCKCNIEGFKESKVIELIEESMSKAVKKMDNMNKS